MAAIPVRLPPLPGEALDSWLEAYAHLLHVTVRDIFAFAGIGWGRVNGEQRTSKPWLHQLDEPDLAALSAATGVPAETLSSMTLARYQGTGLAEVTAPPGMRRTPRWWRQLSCSRYCPRCLAANGGRWMLAWRIPWVFACTSCQVLLADTCPGCGRRHQRTRTGQPHQPGRCDLTGLPLPPWHPPRGGMSSCTGNPAGAPAVELPVGGHVLAAQQHVSALISALLAAQGQPAETAALQRHLDDSHAIARAAISAVNGTGAFPAAASAVLRELGAPPGPGAAVSALACRGGPPRQLSPVTAFGVTIADIMLHGRGDDPDPSIAAWLAANGASRRSTSGPADVLASWDRASPALRAALARPLASGLDTFHQLRYRAVAGQARIPRPGQARSLAASLPTLIWPGWALRLMPPEGFRFLPYRAGLSMMLAIAVTGAADCATAQDLIGLDPFNPSGLATFSARLREHGVLEPVTAAICQLARQLGENGAPIDYARRRRLPRIAQAPLDVTAWHRQRYLLNGASRPAAPVSEYFARLRLIELLTGTHPRYLPKPLQLPSSRSRQYHEFILTMPEQLDLCLRRQARALLSKASIREPVTWEPPPGWVTGIPWPGPDPDSISPGDLHPLLRARLPASAIAARLATTADHVLLAAERNPAPRLPAGSPTLSSGPRAAADAEFPEPTGREDHTRKTARSTGRSEHALDPPWLREQYQARQRSLKDIAAEAGVPVEDLAAAARTAGIPVRHGVNGRAHPLAGLGGPDAFPAAVWNAFTRPHAGQRIRRLLVLPGQPSLRHAARQLGIRHALLAGQVRQLEAAAGITLLRTAPDGTITLTHAGEEFACHALAALTMAESAHDSRHQPPGAAALG